MNHSFSLPTNLAQFEVPTLLVIMDHNDVKFFMITDNVMSLLKEYESPIKDIHRSDHETGRRGSGSGGFSGGQETHDREHYECVFCKQIAEDMTHMHNRHEFVRAVIYVPRDLKNTLYTKLDHRTAEVSEEYDGIITHENPLEMVERILKHRGSL